MRSYGLIAFAFVLAACSSGGSPSPVVRGPQVAQAQETTMVVAWRSRTPVVGAVSCTSGQRLADAAPTTEHVFTLTGLAADTEYGYALEHDGRVVSDGHAFRTAGSAVIRFAVVGDSGSGSDAQRDVAAGMAASAADLVLVAGDVVYEFGRDDELDRGYFLPYAALIERIPFYPALGNHDVRTDDGAPLLESLYLPRNSAEGSEHFYSFERGDVHFIALDSNRDLSPGSTQGDWLAADLAANVRTWTVIYLHHPPYSSSEHGSDLGVRAALAPLCDQYGVDVVFTGHDHVYERTHPLAADVVADVQPDGHYVDPPGTIYVVTGGGGKSLYVAGTSSFTATSVSAYHHVVVEISGGLLALEAIARDGAVLDSVTITRTGAR